MQKIEQGVEVVLPERDKVIFLYICGIFIFFMKFLARQLLQIVLILQRYDFESSHGEMLHGVNQIVVERLELVLDVEKQRAEEDSGDFDGRKRLGAVEINFFVLLNLV